MPLSDTRLRLVRLVAGAWLLTGHAFYVPERAIGWGALASRPIPDALALGVAALGIAGALLAFVRRFAAFGAGLLAATILGMTWFSEAYFANYRVFVAALLVVALIAPPDSHERALRWQCALVYAGATIDKLCDPDYRRGRVVASLLRTVADSGPPWSPGHLLSTAHPIGTFLADRVETLASPLAWTVVALEASLVFGFVAGSRLVPALALALHVGIFVATGSTFGVFFHAALAAAFVLTGAQARRAEVAAWAFLGYASTPLARPEVVALVSPWVGFLVTRASEATRSRIGPS